MNEGAELEPQSNTLSAMTNHREEAGLEALQVGPMASGYLEDRSGLGVSVGWARRGPPTRAMQPAKKLTCFGAFADPASEPRGWIAS